MFASIDRLNVRNKIWTIVALAIASVLLVSGLDILAARETLRSEKEIKTRHLVEAAYSVLAHYQEAQKQGQMSEEAAKAA
ncbi:MAG TPA: hypothetical protein VMB75_05050, partial [Rhodocyclaceae bacterium]|nr:hypothetical protein [Rhodocyclaceae bacterium]